MSRSRPWELSDALSERVRPDPGGGRPPLSASTTVYDRFRLWEADGLFARMWAAGLAEFDELVGIDWEWQSMDGLMTKALSAAPRPEPIPPIAASAGPSAAR